MSLFGEKCARCQVRTKQVYEGVLTCETCRQILELKMSAEAEDNRKCPIDDTPMKKEIAHMIVIDRCPTCQGVWLDGGELETIKGGIELKTLSAVVTGFTYPFA